MRNGLLLGVMLAAALLGTAPARAAYDDPPRDEGWYVSWPNITIEGRMPAEHRCTPRSSSTYGSTPLAEVALTNPIQPPRQRVESNQCWSSDSFTIDVDYRDYWGGTTYYYRLGGNWTSRYSATSSFVTPDDSPYVETGWTSEVDDGGVTFRGGIADGGATTTWRVQYGVDGGPLDRYTPTRTLSGDGNPPDEVVERLDSGLQAGTKYQFRFVATNSQGTTNGPISTFVTSSEPPEVQLLGALHVTDTSVELRARVDPNGAQTDYWWDVEPSYGFGPSGPFGAGSSWDPVPVTLRYSGLAPDTEHSFTVLAENDLGVAEPVAPITFRTLPAGASPPAEPDPEPAPDPAKQPEGGGATTTVVATSGGAAPTPSTATRSAAGQVARALSSSPLRALLRPTGVLVRAVPVPSAGRLALTLRPKGAKTVLARATRTLRRAGNTDVRLRPTKAGRAWLRTRRKADLTLAVTFRPAGGTPVTRTERVTLRR